MRIEEQVIMYAFEDELEKLSSGFDYARSRREADSINRRGGAVLGGALGAVGSLAGGKGLAKSVRNVALGALAGGVAMPAVGRGSERYVARNAPMSSVQEYKKKIRELRGEVAASKHTSKRRLRELDGVLDHIRRVEWLKRNGQGN